jgi:hypothetical protein
MALDNGIGSVIRTANTLDTSGDPNVQGIMGTYFWTPGSLFNNLTYSFPQSSSEYTWEGYSTSTTSGNVVYGYTDPFGSVDTIVTDDNPYAPGWNSYPASFFPLDTAEQMEANRAFSLIQRYINVTMTALTPPLAGPGVLRLANSDGVLFEGAEGQARAPGTADAGDIFFGPQVAYFHAAMGNQASLTIFHEIGHALGLTAGDNVFDRFGDTEPLSSHGPVQTDRDDFEYSVMNNPSFIGGTAATEQDGSSPQSYMMYDIAALQQQYGANFGNLLQSVTYSWDPSTGEELINGVRQGKPAQNKIFETVWTGGAISTFDLSQFSDSAWLDMRPGQSMRFSTNQLAVLGDNHFAQGNVYNALVYNDRTESEINNIITGSGDYTRVIGNDLFNTITLGNGRGDDVTIGSGGGMVNCGNGGDTIYANLAYSIIKGGSGNDTLDFSRQTDNSDNLTFDLGRGTVHKVSTLGGLNGVQQIDDTFSSVERFVGGLGNNTFISTAGSFSFFGDAGGQNTIDYSWDKQNLTIDLSQGMADKGTLPNVPRVVAWQGSDTFANVQNFIGGSGNDTIIARRNIFSYDTQVYSFDGKGGVNTAVFHGPQAEYTITHYVDGQGRVHTRVVDNGPVGGDSPMDLINVPDQNLQFVQPIPLLRVITATHGQNFGPESLLTITAEAGDGMAKYAFWNTGAGGAHFSLNGVAEPTSQEIDVTAAQLMQLTYQSGSGPDTLWVRGFDGTQWTPWSSAYTVNAPIDNAPVVTASSLNVHHGQSFAASSLFTLSDADADSMSTYAFWNSGAGGGRFILNGVTQAASQEIDVTAAQLSRLVYQSGSGTDTLWLRANDGILWGNWSNGFSVNAPIDNAPVVTASSLRAAHGASFAATSLFKVSDADGDTITKYAFWNSGTGGGHFVLGGVMQGAGQEIDVTAAQLSQLSYQSGSGADTLWVRANDGILWGNWSNGFTVNAPIDAPPVVKVSNLNATHRQLFAAASLATVSDPEGDAIQKVAFWNSGTGGGHFVLNGVAQPPGQELDYTIGQTVFQLGYQSGSGADTLWLNVYDGYQWSGWSNSFTVTAPDDKGPTVTPTNDSIKSFPNQTFAASSLINYSDPFASPATQYDFWNSGAGGGHFLLNGSALPANQDNIISAGQLSQLTYQVGTGSDTLWARANDGTVWGGWSKSFTISDPPAIAAGETITLGSAYAGEVNFLGDTGTLKLEDSLSFAGTVVGVHGQDAIDLADIGFGAGSTLGYSGNADNSGGTLSVGDGTHTANIALLGSYMASSFAAASDGHGGTLVSETAQSATQVPMVTQPHA